MASPAEYLLNKILFPKKLLIEQPGIIINKVVQKYGDKQSRFRTIFFFEEIMAELQIKSKPLLKNKHEIFWTKIGYETTKRYFKLGSVSAPPSILFKTVLNYIFNGFKGAGQTFCEDIKINKSIIELKGKNNVVSRLSKTNSISKGITKAVLEALTNKETKVSGHFDENLEIIKAIIQDKKIEYDDKNLEETNLYNKVNFQVNTNKFKETSFKELMKFKKITFDENNKLSYKNQTLFVGEIGMVSLIHNNFKEENLSEDFNKIVYNSTVEVAKKILLSKIIKNNIKEVENIISALGYGIATYSKNKIKIKYPPYSKYGYEFLIPIYKGFIDVAIDKKTKIINKKIELNSIMLEFS